MPKVSEGSQLKPQPTPQGVPVPPEAEEFVEEAAAPRLNPSNVVQQFVNASDEEKEKIRIALDLNKTHARQRRGRTTNNDVRNTAKAFGEVTHHPDFIPDPPDRIAQRGIEAVEIWKNRWLEGNGNNLSEYDLDQIAAAAHQ